MRLFEGKAGEAVRRAQGSAARSRMPVLPRNPSRRLLRIFTKNASNNGWQCRNVRLRLRWGAGFGFRYAGKILACMLGKFRGARSGAGFERLRLGPRGGGDIFDNAQPCMYNEENGENLVKETENWRRAAKRREKAWNNWLWIAN